MRLAGCEIRSRGLALPTTRQMPNAEPVKLSAVHVKELAPAAYEEPIRCHHTGYLDGARGG